VYKLEYSESFGTNFSLIRPSQPELIKFVNSGLVTMEKLAVSLAKTTKFCKKIFANF